MDDSVELSIVIPVYNSADVLDELVRRVYEALEGLDFELILVNDRSHDASWEAIAGLSRDFPAVIGLNLRKNSGQDNAIMAGLAEATGDWIVIMDDDLQHSPSDILRLRDAAIDRNADVCFADFKGKKHALWKKTGSWISGKIAELVIQKPRGIYLSPFKVFRGDLLPDILSYQGVYPYLNGLLLKVTDNVIQIPTEHYSRFAGVSNYSFVRTIKHFMKLFTGFSVIPLRLASYTGFAATLLGLIMSLYYFIIHLLGLIVVDGWVTLVLLILVMGGLTLTSLGVIGEYLGRLYLSQNFPRSYIVKERIGRPRN